MRRLYWTPEELTFVTHLPCRQDAHEANLGLFDGTVPHQRVNHATARGHKAILLGKTSNALFSDDDRLPKLHAGDQRFAAVEGAAKIPENLRQAILDAPLSLTLLRSDHLLYFDTYRCHQAIHIGRRRQTIYLPERLLHSAEKTAGMTIWALAEGIIFASGKLLDYLLLVDTIGAYQALLKKLPAHRLGEALQLKLIETHNQHRRDSVDANRSRLEEFADAYRARLLALHPDTVVGEDCFGLAHELFDAEIERAWALDKMERIAQVFEFPRLFRFDRDIIHGLAREMAEARQQSVDPEHLPTCCTTIAMRCALSEISLKTTLGKTVMPKPRATFLQAVVLLGAAGLRNFYRLCRGREERCKRRLCIRCGWSLLA